MMKERIGRTGIKLVWFTAMAVFSYFPLLLSAQVKIDPYQYESTKRKICIKEAVVGAHPLAAQAGLLMLEKGGNAVDAAIATYKHPG